MPRPDTPEITWWGFPGKAAVGIFAKAKFPMPLKRFPCSVGIRRRPPDPASFRMLLILRPMFGRHGRGHAIHGSRARSPDVGDFLLMSGRGIFDKLTY